MVTTDEDGTQFNTRPSFDENFLIAFNFANSSINIGHNANAAIIMPAETNVIV